MKLGLTIKANESRWVSERRPAGSLVRIEGPHGKDEYTVTFLLKSPFTVTMKRTNVYHLIGVERKLARMLFL